MYLFSLNRNLSSVDEQVSQLPLMISVSVLSKVLDAGGAVQGRRSRRVASVLHCPPGRDTRT